MKDRIHFDPMAALRVVREFAQETLRLGVRAVGGVLGGRGETAAPEQKRAPTARKAPTRPDLRPVETPAAEAPRPARKEKAEPKVEKPTEQMAKAAAEKARQRRAAKPEPKKRSARKPAAVEKPTEAMAKAAADQAATRRARSATAGLGRQATRRAAERRKRAEAPAPKPRATKARPSPITDQDRWSQYITSLPSPSRRFLELLEQRGTLSTTEVITMLELEGPRTVGGLIGGLRRWAPRHGVQVPFDAREDEEGNRYFIWTRKAS